MSCSFLRGELIDFVIHHDITDFHVHRATLHYHSAYFRAYFQLPSSPPHSSTSTTRKRAKRNSSPPAREETQHCDHPTIVHCIRLTRQLRLVEQTPVTAANFRLFLCHLCFASLYCYPPWLPSNDIDLDDPPPLSHTFPPVTAYTISDYTPNELAEYYAVRLPDRTDNIPLSLTLPAIISVDWSYDDPDTRHRDVEPVSIRQFAVGDVLDAEDFCTGKWYEASVADVTEGKVLIHCTEFTLEHDGVS